MSEDKRNADIVGDLRWVVPALRARIRELEAAKAEVRAEALREAAEEANEVAQARLSDERDTALACRDRTLTLISTNQEENLND